MAAYANLLSLENIINDILDHDRFSITHYEKRQVISLDKTVVFFQAFLEDFPEKAKNLEARIRDVAAEAEDIIEWFLHEQIQPSYRYNKFVAIPRGIKFRYQLQKVRDEMDSIVAEVMEIKSSMQIKDEQLDDDSAGASSSSQLADTGEINVVGFNEHLIEIKDKLCGWATQLQVVPIFGMGGIGKTTLARNAYDDQYIMEHFQIRVWLTISQNYSKRRILLDLLNSMEEFDQEDKKEDCKKSNKSPEETPELSNGQMALKVHKILSVRRFLIVMDDIWSTKVLDDVKHLFPNANNGSRVMLTTRLTEVATYSANSSTLSHEMHLMDADQSWNLLRQKVFIHQDCVPHNLESIGREIARSCAGLPLAIVVIAGILSTASKTPTSWKEVARNVRSSLATTNQQIENILSLSYNHLPHHLRPCFLYMGGFPEDREIKVKDLIRLWIAESFVKSVVSSEEIEDSAEKYLEDLFNRSLIVVTKRKPNGKVKSCRLHDMLREMCIKISEEEKFLMPVKGNGAFKLVKSMKDQRRISISQSDLYSLANIYSSTIRTLIYCEDTLGSFGSFRLLRVLDLLRAEYQPRMLSDQFFELFHLRYLAFCMSSSIPRIISYLESLQTLIINDISDSCLPNEIWKMKQLRHLIIPRNHLADTNALALENLQTLRVRNLRCSISMMNLIPNITKLRVSYFWGSGELLFHNLVHLTRLEKLHLEQGMGWRSFGWRPNLVVPSSLKKLTLIQWGYRDPYLSFVGPFPSLEVLKLKSFDFMEQAWRTCDDYYFPQLKFLLIEDSNIRQWDTESSHFPRLKSLLIHSCHSLSEIPECIGEIPTLELIELKYCKESLVESAKKIQEEVQSYGDDVFQVRCIDRKPNKEPLPSRSNDLVASAQPWQLFGSVKGGTESERNDRDEIKKSIVAELARDRLSKAFTSIIETL